MEKNLILVPLIIPGAVVRIKPGTRFYGAGMRANPKDMDGQIVEGTSAWLSVMWENGTVNNYEEHDLLWERPFDMAEVDSNKIYFKDPKIKIDSFDTLMRVLYSPKNNMFTKETFYKVENTGEYLEQCKRNKMRSFDDIWILADTYLPGIDVKDVFTGLLLYNVKQLDLDRNVVFKSFANCSTMRRIRYTNSYTSLDNIMYNVDCNKYDSIYSWRELFNMIGIKTNQDLKEWYINKLKPVVDETICKVCPGEETENS
jgi:hypothetical protein